MAKTGIHFKPCKVGSVEAHNERSKEYLESVRKSGREFYFFPDLTHLNRSEVNSAYNGMTCAEIFEKQKETYIRKTGQKPNLEDRVVTDKKTGRQRTISGWSPIREGVAPIKEDTEMEDFRPFVEWCSKNGLNIIRIDLHFDEGYENAKGERTFNRHAHIIVDWFDWNTGKTAKLDGKKMSEAQCIIADALGMGRGEKKVVTGAIHLNPAEYREKKAEEYAIKLENENRILSEENRKLKSDNDTLRSVNTGLSAKIEDSWKFKSRAEKAEANLKAIQSRHEAEINSRDMKIAELEKMAENEKKRAMDEKFRADQYWNEKEKLREENRKLTARIKFDAQMRKMREIGKEQNQSMKR